MNTRAMEYAAKIKEETGGQLEIAVFPNNQLGSDSDMLSQLRSGGIEFFTLSGVILSTLVPVASISGVGFAFKDYNQVWGAMDGEVGDLVRAQIAKVGLVAMDKMLDNGYRHITTSTPPIRTPADIKGVKIRVQISPLSMAIFKSSGRPRPGSTGARYILPCKRRSSMGRKIHCRLSKRRRSMKFKNSAH